MCIWKKPRCDKEAEQRECDSEAPPQRMNDVQLISMDGLDFLIVEYHKAYLCDAMTAIICVLGGDCGSSWLPLISIIFPLIELIFARNPIDCLQKVRTIAFRRPGTLLKR